MDTVSPELRSRNMAAIKRKDTKPERVARQFLNAQGSRRASHRCRNRSGDIPFQRLNAREKLAVSAYPRGLR